MPNPIAETGCGKITGLTQSLRLPNQVHQIDLPTVKESALSLYQERYWDFGPILAAEKLFEREGYQVDHETLRRRLLDAWLWEMHRRRPRHRKRRAHFGELVQMDGSHHRWFSGCDE